MRNGARRWRNSAGREIVCVCVCVYTYGAGLLCNVYRPDGMSKHTAAEVPGHRGRREELPRIHAPDEGRAAGQNEVRQDSPVRR